MMVGFKALAHAQEDRAVIGPASVGIERRSTLELEASADRAARTAQLLQIMTEIDSYQERVGRLGLTLGANFSVKRLAIAVRDDHDRLAGPLTTALRDADMRRQGEPVLPADLSDRLNSLFQVDKKDFDGVFLASEISTDRQALNLVAAFNPRELNPAARDAAAVLTEALRRRLDQAETLRRELG